MIQLQDLLLHDTFGTQIITQKDPPLISDATIEPTIFSDHHPITATLTLPEQLQFTKTWKLDASLLTDPLPSTINQNIADFFETNKTPDINPLNQEGLGSTQTCYQGYTT